MCSVAMVAAPSRVAAEGKGAEKSPNAVGSYMWKFLGVVPIFGPGTYVPGLVTLTSDGTLLSVTGSDQAGPSSVFFVKNTAAHGVWFDTGHRSVGAHALYLNFDPAGGQVVSISKLRITAQFDKDFNNATGEFFQSVFVCPTFVTCPDPFTATPDVPEPSVGLPFTARRIR
jgi:hypothetical protein